MRTSFVKKLLLGLSVFCVALTVNAHGPTRQKVKIEREINASPEAVWAVVGNYADLGSWIPAVDKTEIIEGEADKVGGVRRLTVGAHTLEEIIKKYDAEKMSLTYRITKENNDILPVNNYKATISVMPSGDGSKVVWKSGFYRGYPNNDPPEHLNDEAALKAVTGLYNLGLDTLKAKLESE